MPDARGDQCDNCGRLYDALELKNPRSKISGTTELEIRETEHFFLDMGKMNEPLLEWIAEGKDHWRPNVINFTRGQLELRELRGRAITRDLDWGVTIPIGDYPDKRIYVWYDAVIGYLSAAVEWASSAASPRPGASGGMPTSTPTRTSTTSSARTTFPSTPSSGRACSSATTTARRTSTCPTTCPPTNT